MRCIGRKTAQRISFFRQLLKTGLQLGSHVVELAGEVSDLIVRETLSAHAQVACTHLPGCGAQGAGAGDVVGGFAEGLSGAVVNSSRGILFAHRSRPGVDWRDATRDAARGMREEIVAALSTRA